MGLGDLNLGTEIDDTYQGDLGFWSRVIFYVWLSCGYSMSAENKSKVYRKFPKTWKDFPKFFYFDGSFHKPDWILVKYESTQSVE